MIKLTLQNVAGNTTIASKECIICHGWYFLDEGFKFQLDSVMGVMMY